MNIGSTGRKIATDLYWALREKNPQGTLPLYAENAEIVRYDGAAKGHDEIRQFYVDHLASHGFFEVSSIDQFREIDDVVLWDATVETARGFLLTSDVVILAADGKISRHVPAIRGFWGLAG